MQHIKQWKKCYQRGEKKKIHSALISNTCILLYLLTLYSKINDIQHLPTVKVSDEK